MRRLGVDGCRAGWLVAAADARLRTLDFTVVPRLDALVAEAAGGRAWLAIDMPIGLAERAPRACDRAARALLGRPRAASVFPAPCRAVLGATSYRTACAASRRACGKAVSLELYNILAKIREVDALLTPAGQGRVRECHPEVTFAMLAGGRGGLRHAKRTPAGARARLALLGRALPPFDPEAVRARLGRAAVARDDVLDAAACLVTADRLARGKAWTLPRGAPVEHDARGLRMEIVA